jgi:hypothetical protein
VDALQQHGIHIIVAEADKSVYGLLDEKSGRSDDAAILNKFSHYATRDTSDAKMSIADCKL